MNTSPQSHHPSGPSNFPAWAECPCYDGEGDLDDLDVEELNQLEARNEEADDAEEAGADEAPKKEPKPDAKMRGSLQHEAHAKAIHGVNDAFAGLSEREEKEARWAAETIVSRARGAGYEPYEVQVEQRVSLLGSDFKEIYFGTSDIEYGPFVEDVKYGDERNYFPQLCGYALPKMEREGLSRVQGALHYARYRRTRIFVISKETSERVVYGILARRQSPVREPKPCQYCSWCRHKVDCPAINAKVAALVNAREDWALKLPTARASLASNDPVVLGAMRFLWKAYIEPWGQGVEYLSSQLADRGITPLGFDARSYKGRKKLGQPVAVAHALKAAGMTTSSIVGTARFSPKRLAEGYHAVMGGTKADAARAVEEILGKAGLITQGEPTVRLIRSKTAEDDIRLALARPATATNSKDLLNA